MMTVNTTTQTTPKNSLPVKLPDGNMSTIYFWRQLPVEVKSSKNNPGIDSTSVLKGEIIEAKSQIFSTNPIDQVSVVPLSPKAATSTYLTNGSISFQVTVYIDTKCSPKNLNLYFNFQYKALSSPKISLGWFYGC